MIQVALVGMWRNGEDTGLMQAGPFVDAHQLVGAVVANYEETCGGRLDGKARAASSDALVKLLRFAAKTGQDISFYPHVDPASEGDERQNQEEWVLRVWHFDE